MNKKRENIKKEIEELRKKGKKVKEISNILNLPCGTVSSIIQRSKIKRYCRKCGKELKSNERSYCRDCLRENILLYSREYMRRNKKKPPFKLKTCPICGDRFINRRSDKIYCSESCAEISWREKSRKWQRKNRSENKIYRSNMLKGFTTFDEEGNLLLSDFQVMDFPTHGDLYSLAFTLGTCGLGEHRLLDSNAEKNAIEKEMIRVFGNKARE
jgi:predicted nucleic acid-binding Zn ribbon protein